MSRKTAPTRPALAVAALPDEVAVRPLYGRVAEDNLDSARVLQRNGLVLVGGEDSFAAARQATITGVFTLPD